VPRYIALIPVISKTSPRKGRRASLSDLAANREEVGHPPGNGGQTCRN